MTQDHRPLAVDADGYVWRINDDGSHSMARTNPDNSPTPEPLTVYVPTASGEPTARHTITTTVTTTYDRDDAGQVFREVVYTVQTVDEYR